MLTRKNSNTPVYGLRSNGKAHGEVFTRLEVVYYMLDEVGYRSDCDLSSTVIIDPSCGLGAFLFEIVERLYRSSRIFGFNFIESLYRNVRAYDIDEDKLLVCRDYFANRFPDIDADKILIRMDFLSEHFYEADIVVGNPPYIRYEQIPKEICEEYKRKFFSFHYRPDLYVLFFEKGLSMLKEGGRLCLITPNRWLRNEYGKKLRRLIAQRYRILAHIDMKEAQPFMEEVLAYPSITLISNEHSDNFETFRLATTSDIRELEYGLDDEKDVPIPMSEDWSGIFIQNTSGTATIEELGFSIGVGVATGADNIFISKNFPSDIESELLLPVIGSRNLQGSKITWNGECVLSPFTPEGDMINLDKYPGARNYLLSHRDKLSARYVAKRNPEKWYKTIDRIKPSLQKQGKLLLPEISSNEWLVIDRGEYYPLHNVYYITGRSENDLRVLASILMSTDISRQLSSLATTMNGGYTRWQSQYLKKLRIPCHCFDIEEEYSSLERAFRKRNIGMIDRAIAAHSESTPIKNGIQQRVPIL